MDYVNYLLGRLLGSFEGAQPRFVAPRVVLVGTILDDLTLPALLDQVGVQVVGDDLCTGFRWWRPPAVSEALPPLDALAERFLQREPRPAKHRADNDPGRRLVSLCRDLSADGVVFYQQKFCDPFALDLARARAALTDEGIPSLVLEDDAGPAVGQWRTRLQAFAERLAEARGGTGARAIGGSSPQATSTA